VVARPRRLVKTARQMDPGRGGTAFPPCAEDDRWRLPLPSGTHAPYRTGAHHPKARRIIGQIAAQHEELAPYCTVRKVDFPGRPLHRSPTARLSRTDSDGIENLGGWLTTTVARVSRVA
jgi:hypothetical protein